MAPEIQLCCFSTDPNMRALETDWRLGIWDTTVIELSQSTSKVTQQRNIKNFKFGQALFFLILIGMHSWYCQHPCYGLRLIVYIVLVLQNHRRTRGPSVAPMQDLLTLFARSTGQMPATIYITALTGLTSFDERRWCHELFMVRKICFACVCRFSSYVYFNILRVSSS